MRQHVPIIGNQFIKEVPPSDNVRSSSRCGQERKTPNTADNVEHRTDRGIHGWADILLKPFELKEWFLAESQVSLALSKPKSV